MPIVMLVGQPYMSNPIMANIFRAFPAVVAVGLLFVKQYQLKVLSNEN